MCCSILWLIAGFNVVRIGVIAWQDSMPQTLITVSGAIAVMLAFGFMFIKIALKNLGRIASLPHEKLKVWNCMSAKSYAVMGFMILLGACLRSSDRIPRGFIASFYTGLGTALSIAGLIYLWASARKGNR